MVTKSQALNAPVVGSWRATALQAESRVVHGTFLSRPLHLGTVQGHGGGRFKVIAFHRATGGCNAEQWSAHGCTAKTKKGLGSFTAAAGAGCELRLRYLQGVALSGNAKPCLDMDRQISDVGLPNHSSLMFLV